MHSLNVLTAVKVIDKRRPKGPGPIVMIYNVFSSYNDVRDSNDVVRIGKCGGSVFSDRKRRMVVSVHVYSSGSELSSIECF